MQCERCRVHSGNHPAWLVDFVHSRKRRTKVCAGCYRDLADVGGHRYFTTSTPLWCTHTSCAHWWGTVYYTGDRDPQAATTFHDPIGFVVCSTKVVPGSSAEQFMSRGGRMWVNFIEGAGMFTWLGAQEAMAEASPSSEPYVREATTAEFAAWEGVAERV